MGELGGGSLNDEYAPGKEGGDKGRCVGLESSNVGGEMGGGWGWG